MVVTLLDYEPDDKEQGSNRTKFKKMKFDILTLIPDFFDEPAEAEHYGQGY